MSLDPRNVPPPHVKAKRRKSPSIERALSNWAKKMQSQGQTLSDEQIKDRARHFTTVVLNEDYMKIDGSGWLDNFKNSNGIGVAQSTGGAFKTNISDNGLPNPESNELLTSPGHNSVSPTSSSGSLLSSSLSATKSEEYLEPEYPEGYFTQQNGEYRYSSAQSNTSLPHTFTDMAPSPSTPSACSPDQASLWLLSQQARLPYPGNNHGLEFQPLPLLGVDPSCISTQVNHPLTPKYTISLSPLLGIDSAFSSPRLRTPAGVLNPGPPTPDDVRIALDTLLAFTKQSSGAMEEHGHLLVLKLSEKIHRVLLKRLYPIVHQDCETTSRKE